jgi:hypothetical protein
MYRDTDGASLVGYGTGNSLANPPGSIGAELVTAVVIKLLNGSYKADVSFLKEVKKRHTPTDMLLGNADHQTEIGFYKVLFGFFSLILNLVQVRPELIIINLDRIYQKRA